MLSVTGNLHNQESLRLTSRGVTSGAGETNVWLLRTCSRFFLGVLLIRILVFIVFCVVCTVFLY